MATMETREMMVKQCEGNNNNCLKQCIVVIVDAFLLIWFKLMCCDVILCLVILQHNVIMNTNETGASGNPGDPGSPGEGQFPVFPFLLMENT